MQIIGITGTLGAGKGTVVEYLVKNRNFNHYSVSGFLKDELIKVNKEVNRTNLQDVANEIRTSKGPDFITQQLFKIAESKSFFGYYKQMEKGKESVKYQGYILKKK